jgi:hypothetical protein
VYGSGIFGAASTVASEQREEGKTESNDRLLGVAVQQGISINAVTANTRVANRRAAICLTIE